MSKKAFEVKEDSRSLHNLAWGQQKLGPVEKPDRNSELEGKFIYLQTGKAVYSRAHVFRDNAECLLVRYVKKTDKRTGEIVRVSDTVQKRDIEFIRIYKD